MVKLQKTLICIIGETRAWQHSWPSFKKNVLDPLDADLAVCIGVDSGYDFENAFWTSAKFHWVSEEFDDYGAGFDCAQSELITEGPRHNWRELLKVKNQWLGGVKGRDQHPGSGGLLIYYRWLLLKNLRSSGALNQYDRFIITRSDFVWLRQHPDMAILDPNSIWVPDGEYYMGITDRHAVCSKANIEPFLDLIVPIVTTPLMLIDRMKHRADWNLELFIRDHLLRHDLLKTVKTFPYIMFSVRDKAGATRWSSGIWSDALKCFIKYPSEYSAAHFWAAVLSVSPDMRLFLRCIDETNSYNFRVRNLIGFQRAMTMHYSGDMRAHVVDRLINKPFEVELIGTPAGGMILKPRYFAPNLDFWSGYLLKLLRFFSADSVFISGRKLSLKNKIKKFAALLCTYKIESVTH